MSKDTQSFVETIKRNQLLSPSQLADLTSYIESASPDSAALGKALIERQWLTPYQVRQILEAERPDLVLGPYILLDFLGEGGMGRVYKARHSRLERLTALKVIRQDRLADRDSVDRFLREARAAARLAHPNIVAVYDAGEHEGTHYLAMEFINGADLGQVVRRKGPLPIEEACDYVRQAALGLHHAHEQGLVHRDIKPSNLILLEDQPLVKVLDFGLARLAGDSFESGLTLTGQALGTPDFIAPEQADDSRKADIRSDIFSLGCTLFYLLTRKPAFPGPNLMKKLAARATGLPVPLHKLRPEAPPALDEMLEKMLAPDPEHRYQTPLQVAQACEPLSRPPLPADPLLVSTQNWTKVVPPLDAPHPFPLSPGGRGERGEGRGWIGAAIVGSIILGTTVLFHVWQTKPQPRPEVNSQRDVGKPLPKFTNSIGMHFVLVPSGKFLMGSPITQQGARVDEGPVHEVTLSRPFYLGVHEVTQGQYEQVMKENPSWFKPGGQGADQLDGNEDASILPVENVTWDEAAAFCQRLSQLAGEKGRRYRLPTEAEWEYACRAGTQSAYAFGAELFPDQANFGSRRRTRAVGSYPPNAFGIYDMHGNVWEWCHDVRTSYPAEPKTDPRIDAGDDDRILRGGGWQFTADECRSASRVAFDPGFRSKYHGFRIVCEVKD